ncbi:MAG: hypothetical protein COT17_07930 [Elusimicrobia bacterium CG08_land_8_20_14_0_20_51_18]|nr:MAG: hypothetical protein COT17_07930 [Elusimicrobia bacterium CG08_land_8_20_14_0_20_51_18]
MKKNIFLFTPLLLIFAAGLSAGFTADSLDEFFNGETVNPVRENGRFAITAGGAETGKGRVDLPGETPLADWQKKRLEIAMAQLAETPVGKALAPLKTLHGIEIRWVKGGDLDGEYAAKAYPPVDGKTGAEIHLNIDRMEELFPPRADHSYLASILAHELSHEEDFFYVSCEMEGGGTFELLSEIKAHTAQVAVYNYLAHKGKAPKPDSSEESYGLARVRFNSKMFDCVKAGEFKCVLPGKKDFLNLTDYDEASFSRLAMKLQMQSVPGQPHLTSTVKHFYSHLEKAPLKLPADHEKYGLYLNLKALLDRTEKANVLPKPENPGGGNGDGGATGIIR